LHINNISPQKLTNYLKELDNDLFCEKLSYYFNELNAAHPFREGNGRTLRAFFDILAEQAGYRLDWNKVSKKIYLDANVQGFEHGNYEKMEQLFKKIVVPFSKFHSLTVDNLLSNDELTNQLKLYVSKQVQLTEIMKQKNALLIKKSTSLKNINEKVKTITDEIKKIGKGILFQADVQAFLKNPDHILLQKRSRFSDIHERFQENDMRKTDILTILLHIKNNARYASQANDKNHSHSRGR